MTLGTRQRQTRTHTRKTNLHVGLSHTQLGTRHNHENQELERTLRSRPNATTRTKTVVFNRSFRTRFSGVRNWHSHWPWHRLFDESLQFPRQPLHRTSRNYSNMSLNPNTSDGQNKFLQIQFDCQVVERQLLPTELSTYIRFVTHLQCLDQVTTCQVSTSSTVYLRKNHCGPKSQIVNTKECRIWT